MAAHKDHSGKGISDHQVQQAKRQSTQGLPPWLLSSLWGNVQDPHGAGPSGSVSVVVSVPPWLRRVLCSPGTIRQLLAGAAAAGAAACPARCGAGPVLVRQRDDIVVDARLQLLDLLGCCLGGEDALCLGHRRIRHC